jgi:hypothetical protein
VSSGVSEGWQQASDASGRRVGRAVSAIYVNASGCHRAAHRFCSFAQQARVTSETSRVTGRRALAPQTRRMGDEPKMTAQPHDFLSGGTPGPARNLCAIRAALVVRQDREAFGAGLKAVLDEVRVNLDLGALNDFVHRWWISACDSARDPEGRRRMHARAEQVLAGEAPVPARPWREILAERQAGQ